MTGIITLFEKEKKTTKHYALRFINCYDSCTNTGKRTPEKKAKNNKIANIAYSA